mgnify:CR=1 FL=1
MNKPHKYHAQATEVDGIRFDSKAEASRYVELKLLVKAGEISGLQLQVRVPLEVNGHKIGVYVADFVYLSKVTDGQGDPRLPFGNMQSWNKDDGVFSPFSVIEDVKGVLTPIYKWKKKHVKAQYGIEIQEIGGQKKKPRFKKQGKRK